MKHEKRKQFNERSRDHAVNYRQPWSSEELQWLEEWDGTEELLREIAELLGRTIEACRQQFYVSRRQAFQVKTTTTTTTTTTTYRGWMESDGDGWD